MSDAVVVRVPQINPNDEHAILVRWHVAKGERVRAGQPLATLETTKTTFDVDAPTDGFAFFEHEPNDELAVGAPVAWIADEPQMPRAAAPVAEAVAAPAGEASERFTRKALKLMKQYGLTEADFAGGERVDAEAVERVAGRRKTGATEPQQRPAGVRPLELPPAKTAEIQMLRRVHAQAIPSTVAVEVEGRLLEERLRHEAADHGPVSPLEFVIHEVARLLPEWPELHGYYADGRAWTYEAVSIGFAINIGHSLRVPVVKDTAALTLRDIARMARDLSLRYMRDELTIDDVIGATFTITDLSGEGVVHFIPVLSERQSAILGLCAARSDGRRDVVLTFDHRLSDGMQAARFLGALKARLERSST